MGPSSLICPIQPTINMPGIPIIPLSGSVRNFRDLQADRLNIADPPQARQHAHDGPPNKILDEAIQFNFQTVDDQLGLQCRPVFRFTCHHIPSLPKHIYIYMRGQRHVDSQSSNRFIPLANLHALCRPDRSGQRAILAGLAASVSGLSTLYCYLKNSLTTWSRCNKACINLWDLFLQHDSAIGGIGAKFWP